MRREMDYNDKPIPLVERELIIEAMQQNNNDKSLAAKQLGISIKILYNLIHERDLWEKYCAR